MVSGFKKQLVKQVGIAGGAIALLTLFIIVLNFDINKHSDAISVVKDKLELRNRTIELLSSSNNDLKKSEVMLDKLRTILPEKDDLIDFTPEIAKLAKSYGLEFGLERKTEQVSTPSDAGFLRFIMTVSGEMKDIYDFLSAFEKHRYLIRLDSIDIRSLTKNKLTMTVMGAIYTK